AVQLQSGDVMLVGGEAPEVVLERGRPAAWIYDEYKGQFVEMARGPSVNRFDAILLLLPTGKVLYAGGQEADGDGLDSAEPYGPGTDEWTRVPPMSVPRILPAATVLQDGQVLVTGGAEADIEAAELYGTAEVLDPESGLWFGAGTLSVPRFGHTASLLPSG